MAWGACRALAAPGGGTPAAGAAHALAAGAGSAAFAVWLLARLRRRRAAGGGLALPPASRAALAVTWAVVGLNLLRCVLAAAQAARGERAAERENAWDTLWLVQDLFDTAAEALVLAYLLVGYAAPTNETAARVALSAGALAAMDALAKAVAVYGGGLALFVPPAHGVGSPGVWAFWAVRSLLVGMVYAVYAFAPRVSERARALLPARPTYARYAELLGALYATYVLGCIMLLAGTRFGYCPFGIASTAYAWGFPPLVYFTFVQLDDAEDSLDLYQELHSSDLLSALEL